MVVTVSIHDDGGCGHGEEGIEQDSAARAGHHCNGDGDGNDREPYVVFGYGSLIFRVTSFLYYSTAIVSRTSANDDVDARRTHVPLHAAFFVQPPPHVIKTSTCHFHLYFCFW